MFTDEERAYFVAQARKAYQQRIDAAGSAGALPVHPLAWAYALLDEAEDIVPVDDPLPLHDIPADRHPDVSSSAPGPIGRALESPARVTMWAMGIGAMTMLAIAVLDALHLPGLPDPVSRTLDGLESWFPANVIVAALLVFGFARAARWIVARLSAGA